MIETKASILCPLCGIRFIPTQGSLCSSCMFKSFNSQKLLSGDFLNFCKYCKRFERPPWINCQRESQQMMAILLKKIKGLNKVEFQSAEFIWTEPHSKRMKLKVHYSREVQTNMKMEITEVVQFIEKYAQCLDCKKKFTSHDWVAVVQVRQQVDHKKTIYHLQHQILQQKISQKIIKTEDVEGGIDIFFQSDNDAVRLVDFLKSSYPCSTKVSSKLVSYNERDNTSNLKITYSCLLPKICRDDLVHIPHKLSKQLGGCCKVLLCIKVCSCLHFIDPVNFKKIQINATQYFLYDHQIEIFTNKIYGKKYQVLDCQLKSEEAANKFPVYDLTFMKEDQYIEKYTKCHFEAKPGTDIIGYELTQIESIEGTKNIPDFLMVKKLKDRQQKPKIKENKNKKQVSSEIQESNPSQQQQQQKQQKQEEGKQEDTLHKQMQHSHKKQESKKDSGKGKGKTKKNNKQKQDGQKKHKN